MDNKLNDNILSKNVRPAVLMYLIIFITVLAVADAYVDGFDVPDSYISLFQVLITTVAATYYGARSVEKINTFKD
jgi:hypothetical protein